MSVSLSQKTRTLLLSSAWRALGSDKHIQFHDPNAGQTAILNALSTVLYTGTVSSRDTPVINAVARVGDRLILAINELFSDEARETTEKEISTTPADGQQLLRSFGECSGPITFDQHSTDVINVLLYLQSLDESQRTEGHKGSLILLSIYRSIHKVAWRVKYIRGFWSGQTPFEILESSLTEILEMNWPGMFKITMSSLQQALLSPFIVMKQDQEQENIFWVDVDTSNIRGWCKFFNFVWTFLEETLLDDWKTKPKVKSARPDHITIQKICLFLSSLLAVRAVIKHIFSLPVNSFQSALTDASNATTSRKSDNQLAKGASPQDLLKLQEEAPFLEEAINYQEDLWLPDLQEGQPDNSSTQVLRFLDAATGWLTACSVLWDAIKDKYFQDLKFYRLPAGAPYHQLDIPTTAAFLRDIYPGIWQLDADAIATKINEAAACAKCHAEAALMSKYLSVESCEVTEIWVGVCKKLCLLCLALVRAVNEAGQLRIHVSAGSHGTVFAWIPPEGVPENIMDKLYINLRQLKSHLKVSHTRQSSGVGTEVKFELPKSVFVEDLQDALEKAALEHQ